MALLPDRHNQPVAIPENEWVRYPNFGAWEFWCRRCGKAGNGIQHSAVSATQQVRTLAGRPVYVNSGYRCPHHGNETSQHCNGLAVDLVVSGYTVEEMFYLVSHVPAFEKGGIGIYPQQGFCHGDTRGRQARWGRIDGRYVSFSYAWQWMIEHPQPPVLR